ncbi:hypothetical protein YC2023_105741 [Brassica napus]
MAGLSVVGFLWNTSYNLIATTRKLAKTKIREERFQKEKEIILNRARIRDPVYGCVGLISFIQHQNKWLQQDTDILKEQLGSYVSPQAMLSTLQQPQQTQFMPQTQQPQFMLQSQTQQTSFMPLSHEQFPTMMGHVFNRQQ